MSDRRGYIVPIGGAEEKVSDRKILKEGNFLHLNPPRKLWTYLADQYAVCFPGLPLLFPGLRRLPDAHRRITDVLLQDGLAAGGPDLT